MKYYLWLVLLVAVLAGCASGLSGGGAGRAKALFVAGQFQKAAALYEDIARSKPTDQDYFNLLAVQAAVAAGDLQWAKSLLVDLDLPALPREQRQLHDLLLVQINLQQKLAKRALTKLQGFDFASLSAENKILFYRLLSETLAKMGDILGSVRARIQLATFLQNPTQRLKNKQDILRILYASSVQPKHSLPAILGGWVALADLLRDYSDYQSKQFATALAFWKFNYPEHPATTGLVSIAGQQDKAYRPPAVIALLLPEAGNNTQAALAIKAGFTAAYEQSAYQPVLRFYNSASGNISQLYEQAVGEGAQLVIGPLGKSKIKQLLQNATITVPVLALNSLANTADKSLIQFGLSPSDEARQIVARAAQDGHNKVLLLAPNNSQGIRVGEQLAKLWAENGGLVLETQWYEIAKRNYPVSIKELLNLDESKQRYQTLAKLLKFKPKYTERRRQDAQAIFLVAPYAIARSIYPQIQFYHAKQLPVYATSHVYSGVSNPSEDTDLNSITFCDIPWLFDKANRGALSMAALNSLRQQFPLKDLRLIAFGIDTFNISRRLHSLGNIPYAGATGLLRLGEYNRISRELVCAKFALGKAVLQNFKQNETWFKRVLVDLQDTMNQSE